MKLHRSASVLSFGLLAFAAGACSPKKLEAIVKQEPNSAPPPPPAAAVAGAQNVSEDASKFIDAILGARDKYDIWHLLEEKQKEIEDESNFDKKADDYRLAVTLSVPLLTLKGMAYRMRPIVEKEGFIEALTGEKRRSDAVQSMFLSILRNTASALPLMAPTSQWSAGFSFFTEPLVTSSSLLAQKKKTDADFGKNIDPKDEVGEAQRWDSVTAAQNYMCGEVRKSIVDMKDRLAAFKFSNRGENGIEGAIVMDARVAFGVLSDDPETGNPKPNDFLSKPQDQGGIAPLNRFAVLRLEDVRLMAAGAAMGLHNLSVFCAYDQSGAVDLLAEVGSFVATDGFGTRADVQGLTALERDKILKKVRKRQGNGNYLKVRNQADLQAAWGYLQKSVEWTSGVWETVKERNKTDPLREMLLANPLAVSPFDRWTESNLDAIKALVATSGDNQFVKLVSPVTGESVEVNLRGFYFQAPNDSFAFLPQDFDKTGNGKDLGETLVSGKSIAYRNFRYGRPLKWSKDVYGTFLKYGNQDAGGESMDIRPAIRVLGATWGGWLIAGPLAGLAY
jgi:hypothetical protein